MDSNITREYFTEITSVVENGFTFSYLQSNLEAIPLPNDQWCAMKGNELFFGFQRVEDDATIKRRVAVMSNLSVKIYVNDRIMPLSKLIKFNSIRELSDILEAVDNLP